MAEYNSNKRYDRYKRDPEARRFYKSKAWQRCRAIVLARDDYLCQECLKQGKLTAYDVVHHIKPRREHPELAFEESNLECLCHACHNKEHPEKGQESKEKTPSKKIKVVETEANPNKV